ARREDRLPVLHHCASLGKDAPSLPGSARGAPKRPRSPDRKTLAAEVAVACSSELGSRSEKPRSYPLDRSSRKSLNLQGEYWRAPRSDQRAELTPQERAPPRPLDGGSGGI